MNPVIRQHIIQLKADGLNLREIGERVGRSITTVLRHLSVEERNRQATWRADQKRRIKAQLVKEAGSACVICGYKKYIGALEFHHLDPAKKSVRISRCYSLDKARLEVKKCRLLCSNCHKEIEGGVTMLPSLI